MSVVARFECIKKEKAPGSESGVRVYLEAVCSEDENHPNKQFWDATPSGTLDMFINMRKAANSFMVGKEYELTFNEV